MALFVTTATTWLVAKLAGVGAIAGFLGSSIKAIADNPISRVMAAIALSVTFFTIILSFLPVVIPPPEIADSIVWIIEGLYAFDWLIPVDLLFFCFTTVLLFQIVFMMIKIIMWLKKHLTQQH